MNREITFSIISAGLIIVPVVPWYGVTRCQSLPPNQLPVFLPHCFDYERSQFRIGK